MWNLTVKITCAGQPCRHCGTPVERKQHGPGWKPKSHHEYYFEWWLKCPNKACKAVYFVEAARRWTKKPQFAVDDPNFKPVTFAIDEVGDDRPPWE
jgi:hypothetical protein